MNGTFCLILLGPFNLTWSISCQLDECPIAFTHLACIAVAQVHNLEDKSKVFNWSKLSRIISHILFYRPLHCSEWGLAAVPLCLGALSGCEAPGSVLLSLLARWWRQGLPSQINLSLFSELHVCCRCRENGPMAITLSAAGDMATPLMGNCWRCGEGVMTGEMDTVRTQQNETERLHSED